MASFALIPSLAAGRVEITARALLSSSTASSASSTPCTSAAAALESRSLRLLDNLLVDEQGVEGERLGEHDASNVVA